MNSTKYVRVVPVPVATRDRGMIIEGTIRQWPLEKKLPLASLNKRVFTPEEWRSVAAKLLSPATGGFKNQLFLDGKSLGIRGRLTEHFARRRNRSVFLFGTTLVTLFDRLRSSCYTASDMDTGRLRNLFEQHPVLLAYLFGSQASGHARPDSDVDIAVLLKNSLPPEQRLSLRMTLIGELTVIFRSDQIDLVILNDEPPLLAYEVLRGGKLLYCADEDVRVEFQVQTLRVYDDTAPLRKILSEAMTERLKSGNFGKPLVIKP